MTSIKFVRTCLLFASALAGPALVLPGAASAQTAPSTAKPAPAPTRTTAPVATTERPLVQLSGDLTASARGSIRTFEGDVTGSARGSIRTFSGDLTAFARGSIRTFEGDVNPFAGDLQAFWGSIRTFTEDGEAGQIAPEWSKINTFWIDANQDWNVIREMARGSIRTFEEAPEDYIKLAGQLQSMVSDTEQFWGSAVTASTGKSFTEGFSNPLLAKHGINLSDARSLSLLSADQLEYFFLDWYDNLMSFSGADHVDHWMKQANWTPKLTQVQGSGTDAVIGLVDFYAAHDPDVKSKLIYSGGYGIQDNGHGVGVLSLINASHDGRGVMGIAPNAKVAAYNPFDSSGTASWDDVKRGILEVANHGAAVINLSLGVPGTTLHSEWRNVFKTPGIAGWKDKTIYVLAAGNDGVVQTSNIEMKDALDSTFLVVGSVDPSGQISSFSNTPGMACLTDGGKCGNTAVWNGTGKFAGTDYLKESGLLMNRFLVAPGEFILVSDGKGGVTRMSGTSFAAPLVAGTIALIHDRWPWLKKYPRDVAKAILESATDLGAPGVDPVYGHGMLNVEAAQSALDFEKLRYFLVDPTSKGAIASSAAPGNIAPPPGSREIKVSTLRSTGVDASWVTKNLYFSAFEQLDKSYRDYLIPLSDRLVGTTRNGEYFQEFVYNRFMAWLDGSAQLTGSVAPLGKGFSDLRATPMAGNLNGWKVSVSGRLTDQNYGEGYYRPRLRSAVQLQSPGGKFGFSVGQGDGAVYIGGQAAFQSTSDFDAYSGGVNPLLGFASGGAHIASRVAVAPNVSVSVGLTEQRRSVGDDLRDVAAGSDRSLIRRANRYNASAMNVRVDYRAADWLDVSASVTRLDEDQALLGIRSIEPSDFDGGTVTDGVTMSATANVGGGVSFFGSATGARSRSGGDDAQLRISRGGLLGSAYQLGVAKERLLGKTDSLRVSLTQPLTTEAGQLEMAMVRVIDRETGEIGVVNERFDINGQDRRRFIAEVNYGASMMGGRASLSLFGRGELRSVDADMPRLMMGSQARLAF